MEAYKIEHLNKSYADKTIFDNLDLSISEGEKKNRFGGHKWYREKYVVKSNWWY